MYDYINNKVRHKKAKPMKTNSIVNAGNKGLLLSGLKGTVQKKPVADDTDLDGIGDDFHDDVHTDIKFRKIAANAYLYDESMILRWDQESEKYYNTKNEEVNLTNLSVSHNHTLIVGMGEMGIITNNTDKIMTSNASPCLILVIRNEHTISMAHIFVGNNEADIMNLIANLEVTDHVTLATEVNPLEDDIIENKRQNWEEYQLQKKRRDQLNTTLTQLRNNNEIASYTYRENMANASATFTDGVTRHDSGSEPKDIANMAYQRSEKTDRGFQHGLSVSIKERHSNAEENDEYDLNKLIQRTRVYKGPTRQKEDGFNEDEMYNLFSHSPAALRLEHMVGDAGFTYAGDTASHSNANTDVSAKTIRINKNRDVQRAVLAFAYELTNAKNSKCFEAVFQLLHGEKTEANAQKYAEGILRIEAEAVFMRTLVALELEIDNTLPNKKYIDIVKGKGSDEEKINQIYLEMIHNGTIGEDKIPAFQYYKNQFMEYSDSST